MGVVWGEGGSTASQCGSMTGAGISDWVQRLIQVAWRRFFLHAGEL